MMNENNQQGYNVLAIGGILLLFIGLVVGISYIAPTKEKDVVSAVEITLPNAFEGVVVSANAAVVYDIKKEEIIFGQKEEAQLPLASVTKLLSIYAATKALGENGYITITPADLATEGDSGLLVSETWKVGDLARFSLISSSNDGANALTRALSRQTGKAEADVLSQTAAALALSQTFAINGTGLDTNTQISGGYGSAKDVALLLGTIYEENRSLLLDSAKPSATFSSAQGFEHHASTTNDLAMVLPQLVGAKTGYTDLAGGNLAVLFEIAPGRPVAVVVLGSTRDGRFEDVEKLVEKTLQHFTYGPAF